MRDPIGVALGAALILALAPPLAGQDRLQRPIPYPVVPPAEYREALTQGTRSETGEPGPRYWQQWTDYRLHARLLTEEKRIEGRATIVYHNRSPDVLPGIALQLLQNIHAEGAMRNRPAEVTGGVELRRVAAAGRELEVMRSPSRAGYLVDGTNLLIRLPRWVGPGDSVTLQIDWAFDIPRRGTPSGRMGWNDDNLFHIAFWYPQMAVYDDVVGWQLDPFMGRAEFYMGFGSYDLEVEVPEGWVVMATGELLDPEQVLAPPVLERYRRALASDSVVHVLGEGDFGPGTATRRSETGVLTWRFHADTVRDVAFSAVRESRWDAVRAPVGDRDGDGRTDYTLVNSFWRSSAPRWSETWRYARHSIAFLSEWIGLPYPWPHMTAVEGGGIMGGGMEFPMLTLIGAYDSPHATDAALYGTTAHELAHMWVPMIVGVDERRYAWMDEGTTSFNSGYAGADYYPDRSAVEGTRSGYLRAARADREGEVMRLSDYHLPAAYGIATYSKPAVLLNTLRGLLGAETFDAAYHRFVRLWAYKHPKPWDLFNFFSAAAGRDLDWFWRAWYYETWTLDQAVGDVRIGSDGTTIVIEDRGWVPMPARITITRTNGESLERVVPVDTWLSGQTRAEIRLPAGSPVARVEIDAEGAFPDIDRSNNSWERPVGN